MAQTTRTSAILDYGDEVRSTLSINHNHAFGRKHQAAEFRFDGTEGAAYAKLGVLLDYPRGEPDELWIRTKGETDWIEVPLIGGWFPDAFVGRMANVQRFAAGEDRGTPSPRSRTPGRPWRWSRPRSRSSAKPATALREHP